MKLQRSVVAGLSCLFSVGFLRHRIIEFYDIWHLDLFSGILLLITLYLVHFLIGSLFSFMINGEMKI